MRGDAEKLSVYGRIVPLHVGSGHVERHPAQRNHRQVPHHCRSQGRILISWSQDTLPLHECIAIISACLNDRRLNAANAPQLEAPGA